MEKKRNMAKKDKRTLILFTRWFAKVAVEIATDCRHGGGSSDVVNQPIVW